MKILLWLLLIIFPVNAFAAVAFVNTNTAGVVSSASSKTVSYTVNAGANLAVSCISYDKLGSYSITSVTYGGNAMTQVGTPSTYGTPIFSYTECYYLLNPPTGANNLVITMNTTVGEIIYNLVAFSGVNTSTPIRAGTYQNNINSNSESMTVTSNVNDLTVTAANGGDFAIFATNQTSDGFNGGVYAGGSDHATTAATSVTHTYTTGTSNRGTMVGFSLDGDTSAPPTVVPSIKINNAKINNAKIGF